MTSPNAPEARPLAELAARIEAAEGGSRELDALLYCLRPGHRFIKMAERGDTWGDYYGDGRPNTLMPGVMLFERTDHNGTREDDRRIGGRFQQYPSSPHYTTSLDAALALVNEKLGDDYVVAFAQTFEPAWYVELYKRASGRLPRYKGATAPLALCAAILKALAEDTGRKT